MIDDLVDQLNKINSNNYATVIVTDSKWHSYLIFEL